MTAPVSPMEVLLGLVMKPSLNGAAVVAVAFPRVCPTEAKPFRLLGSMSFWFVSLKACDELRGAFPDCAERVKLGLRRFNQESLHSAD